MKKLLVIAMAIFMIASCTQKKKTEFSLHLKIDGVEEGMYKLMQRKAGKMVTLDSVDATLAEVVFTGLIESPDIYYVNLSGTRKYITVFMEASDITITGDIEKTREVSITGSSVQTEYDAFGELTAELDDQLSLIYDEYRTARKAEDEGKVKELEEKMDLIQEEKNAVNLNYIINNGSSLVTAYIANGSHYYYELKDLEKMVAGYSEEVKLSDLGKVLVDKVTILRKVAIGKAFTDFSMADPDGNQIALSSLVGENLLLIDFWASWCGPCRGENPNVVAVFNDYKDKGFDILGVSLDTDKEKWLQAVEDDQLSWTHVSDIIGWDNAAGKLYGVGSIPHSVLLDKDGTIIAKNLRGEELREKIAELLD